MLIIAHWIGQNELPTFNVDTLNGQILSNSLVTVPGNIIFFL